MKPISCKLPPGSKIEAAQRGSDFADCYHFDDLWPELNAFETYLVLVARTPGWVNTLMTLRNQAVRLVGLKHLGSLAPPSQVRTADTYKVGERLGIFSLLHIQHNEVVVFDDDKHLRVQVSLVKHQLVGKKMVSLSTVVHIHNGLGRLYMAIVGPVHQIIVPRMLAQIAHA
jgi:hypothetical protein